MDGLEVLLVSYALDTLINVIMSDKIWCTAQSGLDFDHPTVVLTWGGVQPCKLDDSDHYQADINTSVDKTTDSVMDDDRILKPLHECPKGGHPLARLYEESTEPAAFSSDTTSSLSDVDTLFVTDNTVAASRQSQVVSHCPRTVLSVMFAWTQKQCLYII